ncbi:S-adenosyl-L-methionine-dependent methyltransferase [Mycena indigotica]|uniref:S-adenosyl-L-methionine-dependent methyltransferase n=1 Tax=Mycena indigotica TaxID=2126181 RepID=A0A8H6WG76_9AGAR|nr:S-adenosyl-L-methionine-dependent methyltransferase [Mycena indigotica]KAF7316532.1 S-adenosyl-L-methionine-dependent methyltransferase [Mycena indigotica]
MSSNEKLDRQGIFMSNAMGGPIIAPAPLEQLSAILDAGTGTTGWLSEVASLPGLPTSTELHGIDINNARFPHPPMTQDGSRQLYLDVIDLTEPLPEKYHNKFDLVNVRHVVTWLDPTQWDIVYRNFLTALKPGGFVQVQDTRMTVPEDFAKYSPGIKKYVGTMAKVFTLDSPAQVEIARILPLLPQHLPTLGYTDASQTIYPLLYGKLQPDPEVRKAGIAQMMGSARGFQARGAGCEGERLKNIVDGVIYEVPASFDEWDAFITESEHTFNEEGWALPMRITVARKPQ